MNLEELKAMLERGEITQEEFDQKVAELDDKGSKEKDFDIQSILQSEDFQKLIQSEVDKVRTKYSQEKKDLEKKLTEARQKNMTKDELIAERERALQESEIRQQKRELDFETINLLNEKKLPPTLLNFVSGDDLDTRKSNLENLIGIMDEFTSLKAEEKFKSQSRDLGKGNPGQGKSFNEMTVDEKIAYLEANPQEADKLLG
jgi:hypothetical protein